jgi:peptide/nickel transport system permease protein
MAETTRTKSTSRPQTQLLKRIWGFHGAKVAIVFLGLLSLAAILAPWIVQDPLAQNVRIRLSPPSAEHWMGTDELGRDLLSRTIHGARISLTAAAGAVAIAGTVGVTIGLIGGFLGGWRDSLLMRVIDVMLALPTIILALALMAVLGRSRITALVAVGIVGIPGFARITRAQVLSIKSREYVTAVESLGGSSTYAMFRTVLPNSWSPILVQVVIVSSVAILIEASLAFLGLGIPPPAPSWGELLRTGKSYMRDLPTYAIMPGVLLTATVLSLDTLGRVLARVLEDRNEIEIAADPQVGNP